MVIPVLAPGERGEGVARSHLRTRGWRGALGVLVIHFHLLVYKRSEFLTPVHSDLLSGGGPNEGTLYRTIRYIIPSLRQSVLLDNPSSPSPSLRPSVPPF